MCFEVTADSRPMSAQPPRGTAAKGTTITVFGGQWSAVRSVKIRNRLSTKIEQVLR